MPEREPDPKVKSFLERLAKLNAIAISQMKLLTEDHRVSTLEERHAALLNKDGSEKP